MARAPSAGSRTLRFAAYVPNDFGFDTYERYPTFVLKMTRDGRSRLITYDLDQAGGLAALVQERNIGTAGRGMMGDKPKSRNTVHRVCRACPRRLTDSDRQVQTHKATTPFSISRTLMLTGFLKWYCRLPDLGWAVALHTFDDTRCSYKRWTMHISR